MPTKLTNLPAAASVAATDILPVVNGGATKRATIAQATLHSSGLKGIPMVGTDGATPRIGASYEYDEQGTPGHKLTKPVVFHANHYGCKGDGVTDDTAALQALFEAAAQYGGVSTLDYLLTSGVVVFPNDAVYKCDSRLSFTLRQGIILRGPAKIHFTCDGSDPLFSLLSCADWTFEDIHVTYDNAAFSGHVFSTGHGDPVSDVAGITWNRCQIYGTNDSLGGHGAASCISLKNCIDIRIHDCSFTAALIGIDGHDNVLGFANTVLIDGCSFHKLGNGVPEPGTLVDGVVTVAPDAHGCCAIHNPGEAWTITNNTFEPLQGVGYSEVSMNAILQDLDYFSWALQINGNWIGDGDGVGPWITIKSLGASISANLISGGVPCLVIGGSDGVAIMGNRMSAIEFVPDDAALGTAGVFVAGNTIADPDPYRGLAYVGGLCRMANEDSAGNSMLTMPLAIGDFGCVYNRLVLIGGTWDPGTVTAGGYAVSDLVLCTSALVGQALSVGVSPAPPDGVLVTAIVADSSFAKVTVWNMSGTDWTPGTLTMKFHAVS